MNHRTMSLRWTAALLLIGVTLLSCQLLSPAQQIRSMPTAAPSSPPVQPAQQATFVPLIPLAGPEPSRVPTEKPARPAGPLAIADSYPFDLAQGVMGYSLAATPGKLWVGTGSGSVLMIEAASGRVLRTIELQAGGGLGNFVTQMDYDG